jgi:rRNA maturation protein Nop10
LKERFINENKMLFRFTDLVLVKCPECSDVAKIVIPERIDDSEEYGDLWNSLKRRILCTNCGYMKETKAKRGPFSDWKYEYQEANISEEAIDWFFGLPLYLQAPFKGNTFWAFNYEHLNYLERYIRAELRDPAPYYLSVESTLPKWIKLSKNREDLLKIISKMKSK